MASDQSIATSSKAHVDLDVSKLAAISGPKVDEDVVGPQTRHDLCVPPFDVAVLYDPAQWNFVDRLRNELSNRYSVLLLRNSAVDKWRREAVSDGTVFLVVVSEEYLCRKRNISKLVSTDPVKILPLFYKLQASKLNNNECLKKWYSHYKDREGASISFKQYYDTVIKLSNINGIVFSPSKTETESDFLYKIATAIYRVLPRGIMHGKDRLLKIMLIQFNEQAKPQQVIISWMRSPYELRGMYGLPGSGKSFLCRCLIHHNLASFNAGVIYLNFPSNPTAAQLVESYKPLLRFSANIDHKQVESVSNLEQVYHHLQTIKLDPFHSRLFLVVDNISSDEVVSSVQTILQLLHIPFQQYSCIVLLVARTLNLLSPFNPLDGIFCVPSLNEKEATQFLLESANGAEAYLTYPSLCREDSSDTYPLHGISCVPRKFHLLESANCAAASELTPRQMDILKELTSRQMDILKKAVGMIGCYQLNKSVVYLPSLLKLLGSHMRSLDWQNAEMSASFWEKLEQCKQEFVRKLVQEDLCSERFKVLSPDVAFTILHKSTWNLSVLEVALQLLTIQEPAGSMEKELQSLERHYFSAQSCFPEISLGDLYQKLIISDSEHSTCFVLSGEQSAVMSSVEMLHNIASQLSEGGLIAIDLRKLLYCLKSGAEQSKTEETLICKVTNLQGSEGAGDNILLTVWVKPMTEGIPKSNNSFLGQFFDGFHLAADLGNVFKLVNATYSIPSVPSHEEVSKDACSVEPRPEVKTPDEIRASILLENISEDHRNIVVGALYHSFPSEGMEFFFSTHEDMATCVGVGLPHAKILLNTDLSVIIHELQAHDWNSEAALWMPFLSDEKPQLTMQLVDRMLVDRMSAGYPTGTSQLQMAEMVESGKFFSSKFGVGFVGEISHYMDEKQHASRELRWPLLYGIALCVMTEIIARQCNDTSKANSGSKEAPELSHASSSNSNMLQNLVGKYKHENVQEGDGGGGGDGDEGGRTSHVGVDDDEDEVLKIVVHPLQLCHILTADDTLLKPPSSECYGLKVATIQPRLEFLFSRKPESKCISIKASSAVQIDTKSSVLNDDNYFGWYHNNIKISLSCEEQSSGGAAILDSSKICNEVKMINCSRGETTTWSSADTLIAGGHVGARFGAAGVAEFEVRGGASGSTTQGAARGGDERREEEFESVCKGFLFRDVSITASARFFLYHPEMENVCHINWHRKVLLKSRGVFNKIDPEIEGTWIPLNESDASPYLFTTKRDLKLHHWFNATTNLLQYPTPLGVQHFKQKYKLVFYVNHAMTHLRCQGKKFIELKGDHQEVPNVLTMSSTSIIEHQSNELCMMMIDDDDPMMGPS